MKVIYMPLFKEHYGVKVKELDHRKLQNIFMGERAVRSLD